MLIFIYLVVSLLVVPYDPSPEPFMARKATAKDKVKGKVKVKVKV